MRLVFAVAYTPCCSLLARRQQSLHWESQMLYDSNVVSSAHVDAIGSLQTHGFQKPGDRLVGDLAFFLTLPWLSLHYLASSVQSRQLCWKCRGQFRVKWEGIKVLFWDTALLTHSVWALCLQIVPQWDKSNNWSIFCSCGRKHGDIFLHRIS